MVKRFHYGHFLQQTFMFFLFESAFHNFLCSTMDSSCLHHHFVNTAEAPSTNLAQNSVVIGKLAPLHFDKLIPFNLNLFDTFGNLNWNLFILLKLVPFQVLIFCSCFESFHGYLS